MSYNSQIGNTTTPAYQSQIIPSGINMPPLASQTAGVSYEEERQMKANILRKEFLEIDINHLEFLSKQRLYSVLDQKMGKQFDRELGDQLFDRMNKDYSGQVTVDEYIKVFLEAEEILKSKISNTLKSLQDLYSSRKEYTTKLVELKQSEVTNSYGVMRDAYVTGSYIQSNNFLSSVRNAIITISMGEQKYECYCNESQNEPPFKFNVQNGLEQLRIVVSEDIDNHTQDKKVIGLLTVPLKSLNDQNVVTQEYQLFNEHGQMSGGSIVLQLQYNYSRVRYIEQIIQQKNVEIGGIEADLMEFERDIETLYCPFKALQRFYRTTGISAAKRGMQGNAGGVFQAESRDQTKNYRDRFEETEIKAIPLGVDPSENIAIYSRMISLVFGIVTLLLFFERTPFLDLFIVFYYVHKYQSAQLNQKSCLVIVLALAASFLLEIFWLIFFSEHWLNPTEDLFDTQEDSGFKKSAIAITFISLIIKIILMACFWVQIQYFKNNPIEAQAELLQNKRQISPSKNFFQEDQDVQDFNTDKFFTTPEKLNEYNNNSLYNQNYNYNGYSGQQNNNIIQLKNPSQFQY